jgi:undecaprenyl-diphosphatase
MAGSLDDTVTVWIATHRWGPLNPLFIGLGWVEKLGAVWIVLALSIGFALRLGLWRTLALAVFTGVVTFLADSATFGVKDLVHRPRPFVAHPQIHPLYVVHSDSFPAGHAATAFAGAVVLSAVARRWTPAFVALATAVAFSRVYVGDHYVGDALGGAFVGALVALIAVEVVELVAATRFSGAGRPARVFAGSGSQP